MTVDGLVAVWALIVAVIAILPRDRQLDLGVRLGRLDIAVIIVGVVCLHYFVFFEDVPEFSIIPGFDISDTRMTPRIASYISFVLTFLFLCVSMASSLLPKHRVRRLGQLLQELALSGNYVRVVFLIEKYLARLVSLYCVDRHDVVDKHSLEAKKILDRLLNDAKLV